MKEIVCVRLHSVGVFTGGVECVCMCGMSSDGVRMLCCTRYAAVRLRREGM